MDGLMDIIGMIRRLWAREGPAPAPIEPEYPKGVWVEYPDGERHENLILMYRGLDEDGLHLFELMLPHSLEDRRPCRMGVDVLPARTSIGFPCPPGMTPRFSEE